MQNFHCAICYVPNVNTSETSWSKTICYLPPPGDQIFNLCWSWENWEVKCFIFILSPPLLKLNFLFPWFLRGFNYEDDQLTVLDLWLNSQPSIKFVGRKASLRPTFCQLDGEGGSEMESEDRQVDARSPSSSSPSSPPYSNDSRSQAETAFEVLVLLQHLAVHPL